MTRLDKLIELNKLQKLNRRKRLEDKSKPTRILWWNRRVV